MFDVFLLLLNADENFELKFCSFISLERALIAYHYSIFFHEIIIIFETLNKENITQNLQILNYFFKNLYSTLNATGVKGITNNKAR